MNWMHIKMASISPSTSHIGHDSSNLNWINCCRRLLNLLLIDVVGKTIVENRTLYYKYRKQMIFPFTHYLLDWYKTKTTLFEFVRRSFVLLQWLQKKNQQHFVYKTLFSLANTVNGSMADHKIFDDAKKKKKQTLIQC